MTTILLQINGLLAAAVLIVSFALLAYIALLNWRNGVVQALCVLLASVIVVYGGDVLLNRATNPSTIQFLLRAQWLGIGLVPAAYLHLAQALRATSWSDAWQIRRPWLVALGYVGSFIFFGLVLFTDLVVVGGPSGALAQFGAGPLFWVYVLFLVASALIVLRAIMEARRQALTPTLRRRMTYLGITFAAPGLGVFPYLVVAGANTPLAERYANAILLLAALASVGVIVMITVMTYSVAFRGVLLPDRLIKHDFIRWWLHGPVVGVSIILCIQIVQPFEQILGLPRDTLITFAVMIMTVFMPLFIGQIKPYIDALVYMQDRDEIDYLRNLPRHTFTQSDLRQLLENSLIAVCGSLRVDTGFVVGPRNSDDPTRQVYAIKAMCGSRRAVKRFLLDHELSVLIGRLEQQLTVNGDGAAPDETFLACDGFYLLPLHSPEGAFLGALGVADAAAQRQNGEHSTLSSESRRLIGSLAHQMELALTTVQMQQQIFNTLRGLGPEMQSLQQLSSRLEQATPASLEELDAEIALQPEFTQLVKDALSHYWGGPKLSDSPLLGMRTVRRALNDNGGSPTRALQAVLRQAIGNLRPHEQLDPSAQEWMLYNLLELRFLQGRRIREVASRLAMSESDYYRKQRIAIEEVARQLALMEDGER